MNSYPKISCVNKKRILVNGMLIFLNELINEGKFCCF